MPEGRATDEDLGLTPAQPPATVDAPATVDPSAPVAAPSANAAPDAPVAGPPVRSGDADLAAQQPNRRLTDEQAMAVPQPQYRGQVFPMTIDAGGTPKLDWSSGVTGDIGNVLNLPGQVLWGEKSMNDPAVQQQAIRAGTMIPTDIGGFGSMLRKPDTGEIMAAAKGGYDAARDLNVNYTTGGIHSIGDQIKTDWRTNGVYPDKAQGSYGQLDNMLSQHTSGPTGGVYPLADLENQRQAFNELLVSPIPQERRAARFAIDRIDSFYENPGTFVDSGPADQAAQILKTARSNAAAGYRAQLLDTNEAKASARGEAPNADYNKTFAARMRWLSEPGTNRLTGFTDEEKAAIAEAGKVGGGKAVQAVTSALGEKGLLGLGLERAAGIPGLVAGYVGAPAAKAAIEALRNRSTTGSFNRVSELIRSRSPLYESGTTGTAPKFTKPGWQAVGRTQGPTAASGVTEGVQQDFGNPNFKFPMATPSPYTPATAGKNTRTPILYD